MNFLSFRWTSTSDCCTAWRGLSGILAFLAMLFLGHFSPLSAQSSGSETLLLVDPESSLYRSHGVVSGDDVKVEKDSTVEGNLHAHEKVDIDKDTLIDGDVSAGDEVKSKGTILGTVSEGVALLPLPAIPDEDVLRQLADRVLDGNQKLKNVSIDDVLFVAGKVELEGEISGRGTIIATGEIKLKGNPKPLGFSTVISLISYDKIKIDKEWSFRGILRSADKIELDKEVIFEGVLLADKEVKIKKESQVRFLDLVPGGEGDAAPPRLRLLSPTAVIAPGEELVVIAEYDDLGVGVDRASFTATLDGQTIAHQCFAEPSRAECIPMSPRPGDHRLVVSIADLAGNRAEVVLELERQVAGAENDEQAPFLSLATPDSGAVYRDADVDISAGFLDDLSGIDLDSLTLRLNGNDILGQCGPANGFELACRLEDLPPGEYELEISIRDLAGNLSTETASFSRVALPPGDEEAPDVRLLEPTVLSGQPIRDARVRLRLAFNDSESGVDAASIRLVLDGVDITAECEVSSIGALCPTRNFANGLHEILVTLADRVGNTTTEGFIFEIELDLGVSLEEPAPGLVTRDATVRVVGRTDASATRVAVAGVEASLVDGAFEVVVPLREGSNSLSAVASNAAGLTGNATVTVVRDTEAPRVVVRSPLAGARLAESTISVLGEVFDTRSSGGVDPGLEVEVNGIAARVFRNSFAVENLLLVPGTTTLRVEARDLVGNVRQLEVPIEVLTPTGLRLERLSGDAQVAEAGEELPDPLAVRVVDLAGIPMAGRSVTFRVERGNGLLRSFPDEDRELVITTDDAGIAAISWKLGERAGLGSHSVIVSTLGSAGTVSFHASAEAGAPARIRREVGDNQMGIQVAATGSPMAKPFYARVFDAMGNPVPEVDVTFRVDTGGGSLISSSGAGGPASEELVVPTDADGRASAVFLPGPEAENPQLVSASFFGLDELAAIYEVRAVEPRLGPTRLEGLVLDNEDQPVPGTTLHVAGTGLETQADAEGRFAFENVPVGRVLLEVEGSTTPRPGQWPHLEFELFTVAGRTNSVGMPLRLLTIDAAGGQVVGGAADVTIPIEGVPGAELTVFAGSTTFPDGSPTGLLSITQVHGDKVPMVAPLGSNFMLAWTVQPPGVHFDPPARIAIPNLGAEPGTEVEIFSFDHDFGEFVVAGTASVSDDGRQLVSNPGSGISKSGWGGCVTPPPPDSDVCEPNPCQKCIAGQRMPVPKCDKCQTCKPSEGVCKPKEIRSVEVIGNGKTRQVKVGIDDEVKFESRVDGDCGTKYKYAWDFGDGETSTERNPTHEYEAEDMDGQDRKLFEVTLEVTCDCDGANPASKSPDRPFIVVVEKATIKLGEVWDAQFPGAECNRLPPTSFVAQNVPMLLGARSGNTAAVLVKDVEVRPASSFEQVLVGVKQEGSDEILGETKMSSAKEDVEVEWEGQGVPDLPDLNFFVVAGIDENEDGELQIDEIRESLKSGTIRVITQDDYDHAIATIRGWSSTNLLIIGDANAFMETFLGTTSSLLDSVRSTRNVGAGDLIHPVGLPWDSACRADQAEYQFSTTSAFSAKLANNRTLHDAIQKMIADQFVADIKAYFMPLPLTADAHFPAVLGATWAGRVPIKTFDWTLTNDFFESRELQGALGGINVNVELLDVHVERVGILGSELKIRSIQMRIATQDAYDFNIKRPFNQEGAPIQAGWPTLGAGGMPFFSTIEWEGTIEPWPAPRFDTN